MPAINTVVLMGITNTTESKSLTAKAIMYKFVVVRRCVLLQTKLQIKVFPIRDKMLKVMSKLTSTTIKLRLREHKSSDIIDRGAPNSVKLISLL